MKVHHFVLVSYSLITIKKTHLLDVSWIHPAVLSNKGAKRFRKTELLKHLGSEGDSGRLRTMIDWAFLGLRHIEKADRDPKMTVKQCEKDKQ